MQQSLFYLYRYLAYANADALEHITSIHLYQSHDYLVLDRATQVNLELIANSRDGSTKHSLFATLDAACTPMGSRLIKKWIMRPLVQKKSIEQRLDAVELLHKAFQVQREIQRALKEVGDIERVIGRIALGRAPLHDYLMLMRTLALVPSLQQLLTAASSNPLLAQLITFLGNFHTIHALLDASLNTDSAQDFIIKKGFDQRLDHIRELVHCAHEKISTLELEEQQNTRINSLKIGYNGVQGYYIEITKANQNAVPRHYVRLQTLAGRERYMIPALQQLQQEIMHAKAEIQSVEKTVFDGIKREIVLLISPLRKMAHALAHIDALTSFALISYDHNYVRPTFNEARDITILQGRHPIVERVLSHQFIANDTLLTDEQSTWIITGPNMGGKSTYLRQVACMSIMAQIGCFVPAQVACLPLVDRIFTRIGAGDQLALGKSTFLVEMEETATICHQATAHSLVILDEVGRGTSTFDGLAIAQAVVDISCILRCAHGAYLQLIIMN